MARQVGDTPPGCEAADAGVGPTHRLRTAGSYSRRRIRSVSTEPHQLAMKLS